VDWKLGDGVAMSSTVAVGSMAAAGDRSAAAWTMTSPAWCAGEVALAAAADAPPPAMAGVWRAVAPPLYPGLPTPPVEHAHLLLLAGHHPGWQGIGGAAAGRVDGSLQVKGSFSTLLCTSYITLAQPPLSTRSW
jgi:hypothetical protein